ncbi:TIGR01777 family oxidoreductase, partial [Enterobacter intestinihominis]
PATAIRLLMGESSVLVLGGPPAPPQPLEPARVCLPCYVL